MSSTINEVPLMYNELLSSSDSTSDIVKQMISSALILLQRFWGVVGGELVLVGNEIGLALLFCAGFAFFRLAAVKRFFGIQTLRNKQGASVPFKFFSSKGDKQLEADSDGEVQKDSCDSAALQALAVRTRNALQEKNAPKAYDAVVEMVQDGHTVPPGVFVGIVRLSRALAKADDASFGLANIPRGALSTSGVGVLLDYASKHDAPQLIKEVHQRATDEGVVVLPSSCEIILRHYACTGDSVAIVAFDSMIKAAFVPNDVAITTVLSACAESKHVQFAEHLFAYARKVRGKVSLPIYSACIKVYFQARLFEKTCDLYDAMQLDGTTPDNVLYGSLIKAAVESGRLDLARQLFHESGNPDLLNYMSLIRVAGRERDVPRAMRLLGELEESSLLLEATVYNCVLEVCAACGDRPAADELLKRMLKARCCDIVSYNTYLKILIAQGDHGRVGEVLKEIRQRGIKPNVVTYNSLIKGAASRPDIAEAWRLVTEMEAEKVWPDAFTCSILARGIRSTMQPADIDRVIDLIERSNITPDEVLVNCLLDVCMRLRDVNRLSSVLEKFRATGVVPSPHACAVLIKAYGQAQKLDQAWALWKDISGGNACPYEEVVGCMVEACIASGDLAGAANVMRQVKIQMQEFQRTPAIFGAFTKACIKLRQTHVAADLYEELKEFVACGKITYNMLIDALVKQGEVERATLLFQDMALQGVSPDLITYSTLIKGLCSAGDLQQALQLLGQMQRRGILPDAILFNSILDGCAHKQMRALTEQVLGDMEAANIAPSNFTLSILVKLYGRCKDLSAAFAAVENYPKKYAFQPNIQVYTCLMSACIAAGELQRALDLLEQMKKAGCAADSKTYQTLLSGCVRHGDADAAARLVATSLDAGPPLDRDAIEGALLLCARSGRGANLATPLLHRLRQANIYISDRVRTACLAN